MTVTVSLENGEEFVYTNTDNTYFSFSVMNPALKIYENDRDGVKKSKIVATYNFAHVLRVDGDVAVARE
jgi:hypothetical protein